MDKSEAYKLELIDDLIDLKINELKDMNESYEFFIRRLNTFLNEYNKKVLEFSDSLNKQIDEMHKLIDTYKTIYSDSINELKNKKEEILKKNSSFDGELSSKIQDELNRKLISETDKLKNDLNKSLDNSLNEYKKATDNLQKLSSRINKLKDRKYND